MGLFGGQGEPTCLSTELLELRLEDSWPRNCKADEALDPKSAGLGALEQRLSKEALLAPLIPLISLAARDSGQMQLESSLKSLDPGSVGG